MDLGKPFEDRVLYCYRVPYVRTIQKRKILFHDFICNSFMADSQFFQITLHINKTSKNIVCLHFTSRNSRKLFYLTNDIFKVRNNIFEIVIIPLNIIEQEVKELSRRHREKKNKKSSKKSNALLWKRIVRKAQKRDWFCLLLLLYNVGYYTRE